MWWGGKCFRRQKRTPLSIALGEGTNKGISAANRKERRIVLKDCATET